MSEEFPLQTLYSYLAELWCNPSDTDAEHLKKQGKEMKAYLTAIDRECSEKLELFLQGYPCPEEEYIELFELSPQCPLYLGSFAFEEPKTCAGAAVSDRNEYMIELAAIYRHFGLALCNRELPDYLPLMTEFLGLTATRRNDPVRHKFLKEYFLSFLPPLKEKLEELHSPYAHLLHITARVAEWDLQASQKEGVCQ
ncbi:MAG: nitrate reductase molybdenum cofactor assembly chaperone [bacterium JZ-2024 1]